MKRFPVLDEIFAPFIAAIKFGDLKAYDQALEKWETRLLELNLWLSLEKARELCLRSLFRIMLVLSNFLLYSLTKSVQVGCHRKRNPNPDSNVPQRTGDIRHRSI